MENFLSTRGPASRAVSPIRQLYEIIILEVISRIGVNKMIVITVIISSLPCALCPGIALMHTNTQCLVQ